MMKKEQGTDEKFSSSDDSVWITDYATCKPYYTPPRFECRREVRDRRYNNIIQILTWNDFMEFAEYVREDLKWVIYTGFGKELEKPLYDPIRQFLPTDNDRTDRHFGRFDHGVEVSDYYCKE